MCDTHNDRTPGGDFEKVELLQAWCNRKAGTAFTKQINYTLSLIFSKLFLNEIRFYFYSGHHLCKLHIWESQLQGYDHPRREWLIVTGNACLVSLMLDVAAGGRKVLRAQGNMLKNQQGAN